MIFHLRRDRPTGEIPALQEWLLIFAALVLLNFQMLTDRPNWDAAMSVFRAALFLESSDFDLKALLAMPGYAQGGPNTHALTLGTLLTALQLRLFGQGTAFLVATHLLHLAFYSLGFLALRRLAAPLVGKLNAGLLLVLVVLHPVVRSQLAAMYIDLPAATAAIICIYHVANRAHRRAAAWLFVACAFKGTAICVGGALIAVYLRSAPLTIRRCATAVLLVAPSAMVSYLSAYYGSLIKPEDADPFSLSLFVLNSFDRYLFNVPDVAALLVAGFAWAILLSVKMYRQGHPLQEARESALLALAVSIIGYVIFFYVIVPGMLGNYQILIRYSVLALPFLLLVLLIVASQLLPRPLAMAAVVGLIVLELCNASGALYPDFVRRWGNDFSIAERSFEYRALSALQRDGTRELVRIGDHYPIVHEFPERMLMDDPLLGFADHLPAKAYTVAEFRDLYARDSHRFSGCLYFYLVYHPWPGTSVMESFIRQAEQTPGFHVRHYRSFRRGLFEAQIVLVQRDGVDCSIPGAQSGEEVPTSSHLSRSD